MATTTSKVRIRTGRVGPPEPPPAATVDAPFNPPYVLGGKLGVVIGLIDSPSIPEEARRDGFRVLSLFGISPAMVVASKFEEPPAELPIPYDEVIVAVFVRRGLSLASLPLSMSLNEEVPVAMGHLHYSMPKVLDLGLEAEVEPTFARILSIGAVIDGSPMAKWKRTLLTPVSAAASLGMQLVTKWVPVLGVADSPHRTAVVALTPAKRGTPFTAPVTIIEQSGANERKFRSILGLVFQQTKTWLGPPTNL